MVRVHVPVGVPDPGAVDVAMAGPDLGLVGVVTGAVGGLAAALVAGPPEAVTHARGLEAVDGGDVGVGLTRVAEGAAGVVLVQAVSPLVVEDSVDLARVPAPAARAEEVDGGAVPVGVAGVVEVHVGREPALQPGVGREPAPGHLRDLVDFVVGGAGGRGVAGRIPGRGAVVLAVEAPQVQAPGARAGADGAAGVHDVDVLAGEGGGDGPARVVEHARAVGEIVGGGETRVHEGRRPSALHPPARGDGRADPSAREWIDAALDLALLVLVDVLESDDLPAVGVDHHLPARLFGRPLEDEGPDQPVAVALAHRAAVGVAVLVFGRGQGNDLEPGLAHDHVLAGAAAGVGEAGFHGVLGLDVGRGLQPP